MDKGVILRSEKIDLEKKLGEENENLANLQKSSVMKQQEKTTILKQIYIEIAS